MPDSAVVELPVSRGPGAPKGRPKPAGSGRRPGVKNRVTREIRALAGKYSLRALRHTWKLAQEAQDQTVQLKALELLLAYAHGKPSQTTLIGGDGGDPVKMQQMQDLMADPREVARRVGLILYRGNPEYRAAADAEREARNRGGRQENLAEPFNGARAPAGESDGSSDTPVSEAPQESAEAADGASEPEELKPPEPGHKLVWLGIGAIAASEPSRPGLPHQYRLLDCRGTVEKHGAFAALLKHLERRHGSALPTPHLDTVDDHMMSPLWFSQPDQRPPQVFHGHENKRHR
jgi:hypothetical protein